MNLTWVSIALVYFTAFIAFLSPFLHFNIVAEPEFYFGLPDGLSHKVARIQAYTGRELLKMIVNNISMVTKAYGVLLNRNEISKRAMSNPNLGDSVGGEHSSITVLSIEFGQRLMLTCWF